MHQPDNLGRRDSHQGIENSRKVHHPYPHQKQAVKAILKTFKTNSRTHAVMACGTGKTHVCLWVAEKLKAKRIAVFVPSLSLVNQLLHEWLSITKWTNVSYMAVCSDDTVIEGVDTFSINREECNFPVSTSPIEVRKFLKNKNSGIQLVFCTYHSSNVLAAGMMNCASFDLCIFDEAHKTAGQVDRCFSVALDNKNIPSKKKLFVTATPRHFDIHSRNKNNEAKLVYSMDSIKDYGPRAYTLTFRQAVDLDIICNYKVMISIIVTDKYKKKKDNILHEQSIALQKAIENHNINKIITFHHSIAGAEQFTNFLNSTKYIQNFIPLHINSFMKVSERKKELDLFKIANKALISNARCLTEGTNVPAVDMVAFLDRKQSKIDIVQAVGRAMRKHENKKIGYIFLPLFAEIVKGENFELAVNRTHYEIIWDVLQALSEQDEDLHQTINYLRITKGEKGEYHDLNKLMKYIEVMPNTDLDFELLRKMKESIAVSIISRIGQSWYEMYGRLCVFKKNHGHCNIPRSYNNDPSLSYWIANQRRCYKLKDLSSKKISLLNKIGFVWDIHIEKWNNQYQKLINFKKLYGHCNVPLRYDNSLGLWSSDQRYHYLKRQLSEDRIKLLEQIGFVWDLYAEKWNDMYNRLIKFKKEYGHCNVPISYNHDSYPSLVKWVVTQRKMYKRKEVSEDRIKLLEKIGFCWNLENNSWNKQYKKLIYFKKINGHCNVSSRYAQDYSFGIWIRTQRNKYHKNQLSKSKIKLLDKIGFSWEIHNAKWNEMYNSLIKFKREYGHCNVPNSYNHNPYPSLGRWVGTQRILYKMKKIPKKRIKLLEEIGFCWNKKKQY